MVKFSSFSLFFVLLLVINSSNCLNDKKTNGNIKVEVKEEIIKDASFNSLASSCFSVFISGFGDKTFFISTIASISYNKWISAFASLSGLIIMGVISLVLGIEISEFIPLNVINIISSLIFIMMGLGMIYEAVYCEVDKEIIQISNKDDDEKTCLKDENTEANTKIEEVTIFETFGSSDDEALKLQSKIKLEAKFENETKLYLKGKLIYYNNN